MTLSARTRLAGVIGQPVRHSLSPVIHNAAYRTLGIDWVYLAFDVDVDAIPAALGGMRSLGIDGLNVTMPHKQAVARAVDRMTPDAARLGAVNCIVRENDGLLVGHNTDGAGFVDSLQLDEGVDLEGARCVVVGAGGAARSVILALANANAAEVVVVNRSFRNAVIAADLAGAKGRVGGPKDLAAADLIVNATPLGMGGAAELPFDPQVLQRHQIVAELVYHPAVTCLMAAATQRGARTVGGLGMLVHQAGAAVRLWTGCEPPLAVMATVARAALD